MVRCLVTGSEGFIGKHLCARLERDGHTVFKIDRSRYILQDLICAVIPETDVVFHLAAKTGLGCGYYEYQLNNVDATYALLNAIQFPIKKFILASTSSVYGKYANCTEEERPRPISFYGVTKLAQEELCRMYARTTGLPLVIMRLFSVYGPGQRADMAYSKFMRAIRNNEPVTIYGDGTQYRGITYIDDVVDALVLPINAETVPNGKTYNVGGSEPVSVLDVLKTLEQIIGESFDNRTRVSIPRIHTSTRDGDQESTLANTNRIRYELGWSPRVTIGDGLQRQWNAAKE